MIREMRLTLYTIYRNPADYPGKFVVRRWYTDHRGRFASPVPEVVADSLTQARDAIPPGLYRLGRFPGDDQVIEETWI